MSRTHAAIAGLALTLGSGSVLAQTVRVFSDPADAVIRRTDPGNDGPIDPGATIPDVLEARLSGWEPFDPVADPYSGFVPDDKDAVIFRLDIVFAGRVNPPATLGFNGQPFDPFKFGTSPAYGFVDLDIDDNRRSGGELDPAARSRLLANVARFGGLPYDSLGEDAAESADDYDSNFQSDPQYERTGADFAIMLCGCHAVTLVPQGTTDDGDGIFEPGETFVVRGHFFQRAGGFQEACASDGFGGIGLYDPYVNLRFAHDAGADTTTLTLVYALTMRGAAELAGQNEQSIDLRVDNHTSVEEALVDLIDGANAGGLSDPVRALTDPWRGQEDDVKDFLEPCDWTARVLIGMSYAAPDESSFVWTDVGFDVTPGDVDADGIAGPLDAQAIAEYIDDYDDTDGLVDGRVVIPNFGTNFHLYDLDGDGVIGPGGCGSDCDGDTICDLDEPDCDADTIPDDCDPDPDCDGDGVADSCDPDVCPADLSPPFGVLNIFDFLSFQSAFGGGEPCADLAAPFGSLNIFDFLAFQSAFGNGC